MTDFEQLLHQMEELLEEGPVTTTSIEDWLAQIYEFDPRNQPLRLREHLNVLIYVIGMKKNEELKRIHQKQGQLLDEYLMGVIFAMNCLRTWLSHLATSEGKRVAPLMAFAESVFITNTMGSREKPYAPLPQQYLEITNPPHSIGIPDWITESWVGLTLPLPKELRYYTIETVDFSDDRGPCMIYWTGHNQAIEILREKSPDAALELDHIMKARHGSHELGFNASCGHVTTRAPS